MAHYLKQSRCPGSPTPSTRPICATSRAAWCARLRLQSRWAVTSR